MTLNQLYKKQYPNVSYIAIYDGLEKKIYADYADEYLETHGDCEVVDSQYAKEKDVLIVELKKIGVKYERI